MAELNSINVEVRTNLSKKELKKLDFSTHANVFEDLGTVGRLFGALISKAGIPVPTEITQKVLTAAQHIGKLNKLIISIGFSLYGF